MTSCRNRLERSKCQRDTTRLQSAEVNSN